MKRSFSICLTLAALGIFSGIIIGQLNEVRGNAPGNVPQATFFIHRLSTIMRKASRPST